MKQCPPLPPPTDRTRRSGVALVITLAILALVTVAVVAFFSQAIAERKNGASGAHRVQAEQVVASAFEYAAGQFATEIKSHSTAVASASSTLYLPTIAQDMLPRRSLTAGLDADPNYLNLVRQSISSADPGVSPDSTAKAATNGRRITAARWNAAHLLGGAGFSAESQLPSWIYLHRASRSSGNRYLSNGSPATAWRGWPFCGIKMFIQPILWWRRLCNFQ